jgi:hypothetical protein
MTTRRPLGETLAEVAESLTDTHRLTPGLAVRGLEVTLPIELAWRGEGGEVLLLGDLPRTVTRTAFDRHPARLAVVWHSEGRS